MFNALKWLYPGMRVKRWIAVIFLGVLFSCFGASFLTIGLFAGEEVSATQRYGYAAILFFVGGIALLTGVYRLMKSLGELLGLRTGGRQEKQLVDIAFGRRVLGLGPRVVALGGGSGLGMLLEGLKEYTSQVTAVVSVADDGGSSGRLRREFDMLPPGDVRKCLVALSDESPLLGDLLRYRFPNGQDPWSSGRRGDQVGEVDEVGEVGEQTDEGLRSLAGHSFGNLFLTVLWRLTGDFGEAVRQAGRILSIRGRVIPATLDRVTLVAVYEDGSQVTGQRKISETEKRIRRVELRPNPPPASSEIIEAIEEADLVVMGPGSLYTSILPNLLIGGIPQAIARSEAVKVYVANVASSEGETAGFTLKDHLDAIGAHTGGELPFNVTLANLPSVPRASRREIEALSNGRGKLVTYDPRDFEGNGYAMRFVQADLASSESALKHDSKKLARALMTLLAEEREGP